MLEGYRVLDCSRRLGWLAGRVLADLGAEVYKIEPPGADTAGADWLANNLGKRRVTLDFGEAGDVAAFERLVAEVEIVIACPRDEAEAAFFSHRRLGALNPSVIVLSITPFGRDGPRAAWRASDIELMAAGGAMALAGEPDGPPLRVSVPQSSSWAGVQAAVGALIALNHRTATGEGQQVEVSAQASVVSALANAPAFWDLNRTEPRRAGSFIPGRSVRGTVYRVFWPCRDGYLNFILYGGPAGRRTNERLVEWMTERGADLGALEDMDWAAFDPTEATQEEVDAIEEPIGGFFAAVLKRDFLAEAGRREMLGYPVFTVGEIGADEQLAARGFWHREAGPDGTVGRYCGCFYVADGARPKPRPWSAEAPLAAGELIQGLEGLEGREGLEGPIAAIPRGGAPAPPAQAMAGVKVVEFGGYAAGPQIGKILANFGATVVHVESEDRPDGFRLQYPPFKDGKPGINRGGCFAYFNDSKFGVTLDVKKPGGVELARRLVGWSDIVVENMRPGVIARMGLGHGSFRESHPGLVMLSTCNMGQTGPRANTPGFGSQLSALAGFCGLTGEPDGPPMLLFGPYIDFIAANFGAAAVLAAFDKARRTGRGRHLDISQYETGLYFLAGALLEHGTTGRVAERRGNLDPAAVPHDAFRCRGGDWIVLSCWSDAEFAALARAMAGPGGAETLAGDPAFATPAARRKNLAPLNAAISRWCAPRAAEETAILLQDAGVHAYPVNTMRKLLADPQLRHLNIWRKRKHPVIGDQSYLFPPFDLARTPGDITRAGPLLGADNETVFKDFLGLSEAEFAAHRKAGVIGGACAAAG